VNSLRAGPPRNLGSIPGSRKIMMLLSPKRPTPPGTHPASYSMRTMALSLVVKRPMRGADRSPPSSAEVNEWSQTSSPRQPVFVHPQWTPSRPLHSLVSVTLDPASHRLCPRSCVSECVVGILYEAGRRPSVLLSVRSYLQSLNRLLGLRKVRCMS